MALDTTNLATFLKGITDAIRAKTGSRDPIEHRKIDEEIKKFDVLTPPIKKAYLGVMYGGDRYNFTEAFTNPNWNNNRLNEISAIIYLYYCASILSKTFSGNFSITTFDLHIPGETNPNNIRNQLKSLYYTFEQCTSLQSIIFHDDYKTTKWVTTFAGMCYGCTNLKEIYTLNFSSVEPYDNTVPNYQPAIFYGCTKLETLLFVKETIKILSLDLTSCENLSDESVQSIIDGYAKTDNRKSCRLNSKIVERLTDEQLLQAANKNLEIG